MDNNNRNAYQYNNLIIVRNGLTNEGIRQVKCALDFITSKLKMLNKDNALNNLTIPIQLSETSILACRIHDNEIRFYHTNKSVEPLTLKASYSNAVNVIDSRFVYHGIGMINRSFDKIADRYAKVYLKSKINGIELKINGIVSDAETRNDYTNEYNLLKLSKIEFINDRQR